MTYIVVYPDEETREEFYDYDEARNVAQSADGVLLGVYEYTNVEEVMEDFRLWP